VFQTGMVLQRRKPICVWGSAPTGSRINVLLSKSSAWSVAQNGTWMVYLPPMEAATGYTLEVSCDDETIAIEDVAIGEVWLASGQSNMEYLLRHDAEADSAVLTEQAEIRCFEVPKISYAGQEKHRDYSKVGLWRKALGSESLYFTAVGFYFAQKLHQELQVPVGIINCTWGGTSASVFTANEYLTGRLAFFPEEAQKAQAKIDHATELEEYMAMQQMIDSMPFDNSMANLAPIEPDPGMMQAMEGMNKLHFSQYSPFRPSGIYETMLKTIVPYTVSGVIWYQGESDEPYQDRYEELMQAMIACWREQWHETLPFVMVQLASFEQMMEKLDFVPIRAIQENLTKIVDKVWLVCAMDAGLRYDIHPKHKRPVGERLALQALSKVYGRAILADSPVLEGARREGDTVILRFAHSGEGLVCRGESPETLEVTQNGVALGAFFASVSGNELRVTAPLLAQGGKITLTFCQHPFCVDNVYNSAGLPILPFVCSME
jgi:Domain of unknown function (DUF303).